MNAKTISILVIFALLASSMAVSPGRSQEDCGSNEVFRTCGGCEGTCATPHPPCTRNCKPAGCYCPKDFARVENGDCVPLGKCA
uniref:TIL domain-containing protein n=1 Tax=Panagrellus redivivus TaxID=6233 RepID=A0A7E4V8U4_PANRE